MRNNKWLTIGLVLALAMVLLWAVPGMAQMRGRGQGCGGQGMMGYGQGYGQGSGPGAGQGYANSPNNQDNEYCQGNWSKNSQANTWRRVPRAGGQNFQPNTQPGAPPLTQ